jgi:hypothetical protein
LRLVNEAVDRAEGAGTVKDEALKDESLKRIADSGVLPGQRWRHYKTSGVYLVIAVGLHEADLEPLVHYRIANDEYATVWSRHLGIFCGRALHDGTLVSRFERVE